MKIKVGDIIEMKHYDPPHIVVAIDERIPSIENEISVRPVNSVHNDDCLTIKPNWIRRIIKQKKLVNPTKEYFSVKYTAFFLNGTSYNHTIKSNNRRGLLKKMKEAKGIYFEYGNSSGILFEPIQHIVETSDLKGKFIAFKPSFKKPKNYVAL